MTANLSEGEIIALTLLRDRGSLFEYEVDSKNDIDVFGFPVPGKRVFNKLIKKNLVFLTEEEPIVLENGEEFQFSSTYELTDEGRKWLKENA